jgi:uncharacterized protein (TIGR02145 family)
MKNKSILIAVVFLFITSSLIAQVTDKDGNSYNTVMIGSQEWTTSNLSVTHFRNGDVIPEVEDATAWKQANTDGKPAWCYFNSDASNGRTYGKLYNWYAATDRRGLAPDGWHIPSDAEWTDLTAYLGEETVGQHADQKMKATNGWNSNGNGTNESGFAGLPGGSRYDFGTFGEIGENGYWWSTSEDGTDGAWDRNLFYGNNVGIFRDNVSEGNGFSVRCLKGGNENPASHTEAQVNQTTAQEKQVTDNKLNAEKAKGAAFLATNGKRAGVITLPSGVEYEVLQKSNSTVSPTEKDTVVTNYVGTLIDGTELVNSYKSNQPMTIAVNGHMIDGWKKVLRLMHVGNKFKVYIPSSMAYGDDGSGSSIPGGATLIFEIELLSIKPAK